MNHKRRGPKGTRSGCLMCKPWKHQRFVKQQRRSTKAGSMVRRGQARANASMREQLHG